jgi:hypothetical protein
MRRPKSDSVAVSSGCALAQGKSAGDASGYHVDDAFICRFLGGTQAHMACKEAKAHLIRCPECTRRMLIELKKRLDQRHSCTR